jgi:hypothetical protein
MNGSDRVGPGRATVDRALLVEARARYVAAVVLLEHSLAGDVPDLHERRSIYGAALVLYGQGERLAAGRAARTMTLVTL